ncbi:MAG: Mitochondrial fission protein [Trizodia sp. TS-e1964]|nr:MAG: Mitochondrial fission protein [Trizodia sp. TS-e1964]
MASHDQDDLSTPVSDGPAADGILGNGLSSRSIEAFGRKFTTTAGQLIAPLGDAGGSTVYHNAMTEIHKELRRPLIQRRVFSFAKTSPSDLVRSRLSTSETHFRALTHLPDELLSNIPEDNNVYSLFQGYQATVPDVLADGRRPRGRRVSRGQKLLGDTPVAPEDPPSLGGLKKDRNALNHRLEMLGVRKNMASSEIREIDNKIGNLNSMRKIVLDRLASLEQEESHLEHEVLDIENKLDDLQEAIEDAAAISQPSPTPSENRTIDEEDPSQAAESTFMSESIYQKLPSPSQKVKKAKSARRKTMPILHEHLEAGSSIRELAAHADVISAMDFDIPFGTMVTASLDDTVKVWDLNAGRCMGLLEGHQAPVRCLQVEDNIVATGSMDASIRLWDLSRADYAPQDGPSSKYGEDDEDDGLGFSHPDDLPPPPPANSMQDCPLFTLGAHVDEVTALFLKGDLLVSGSADKTLRQWDLQKGRCVQTLDVLWAAAQASATQTLSDGQWRQTGRISDASADFVGALQCFDAALACGTADGVVRLWDLRSGQVHRSLVGHTGPVTCLQFDDVHLVTGSLDRSIRIWDIRTGSIFDAYAYDNAITSMQFDTRRIVSAAGEDVVKVFDKTDGRHWDCGAGAQVEEFSTPPAIVHRVRIKDGYLTEGRRDGAVGIWTC